jgi:hypothetical protein
MIYKTIFTVKAYFFLPLFLFLLFSSCGLVNTANVSLRSAQTADPVQGRQYQAKNIPSTMAITVKGVEHPNRYKKWDLGWRWRPSIHLEKAKLVTNEQRRNLDSGAWESYPPLRLRNFMTYANLELATYTPIGSFVLSLGHGVKHQQLIDGQTINQRITVNGSKWELAHLLFFRPRWYSHFSYRLLTAHSTTDTRSVALKIGYYFEKLPNQSN